ncbi:MAG: BON domain-containing protein [Pseudomonadota bacterium]|nr:BON domain-containing protein [Pseudomonadota bacterium]
MSAAFSHDDAVIADTVRNCLRWSIAVRNKPIEVAVHAEHVTLSGTIKWPY